MINQILASLIIESITKGFDACYRQAVESAEYHQEQSNLQVNTKEWRENADAIQEAMWRLADDITTERDKQIEAVKERYECWDTSTDYFENLRNWTQTG